MGIHRNGIQRRAQRPICNWHEVHSTTIMLLPSITKWTDVRWILARPATRSNKRTNTRKRRRGVVKGTDPHWAHPIMGSWTSRYNFLSSYRACTYESGRYQMNITLVKNVSHASAWLWCSRRKCNLRKWDVLPIISWLAFFKMTVIMSSSYALGRAHHRWCNNAAWKSNIEFPYLSIVLLVVHRWTWRIIMPT